MPLRPRRLLAVIAALALLAVLAPTPASAEVTPDAPVFINELHYDNTGDDVNEFVEVAGPAGSDLTGWTLVRYNGNNGAPYGTEPLPVTIPDEGDGFGAVVVTYPLNGLQNGSPDGVALVDGFGAVVEFLSYEGAFTAVGGPADGLASTDILVQEPFSTPIGQSLQRTGTGTEAGDFSWQGPSAESPGLINAGQTFGGGGPGGQPFPLSENFDTDCVANGWEIVSVDTDTANTWTCSTQFSNADVNGFGDSVPADEWLIAPALDMNAQTDETLEFRNLTNFADIDYPQLEVVYSTDYDGGGDPTTATWTALTGINFSPENSNQYVDSGSIDLSAIAGSSVHFAFHYTSSGTGAGSAATWRIDDVSFAVGGIDPIEAKIHEVQGPGATSPLVDQEVVISGIVVGDFQEVVTGDIADPDDQSLGGFFVQEEDAETDGDPATSEGIFVFDPNGAAVSVGDQVEVTGTVAEFNELTEITNVTSLVVGPSGNPLPTPATPTLPTAIGDLAVDWEAIEGMSVLFNQPLYVTDLFPLGAFGEVGLSATGPWNHPNQVEGFTSPEAAALRDLNLASRVTLDDGETENEGFPNSSWNPDPTPYLGGAEATLRAGDRVDGLLGVVHHSWGEYEVHPINTADPTDPDGAVSITRFPRPTPVPDVGGDLTVATFNVLNYFVSIDDRTPKCGPPGFEQRCRGADTDEEFALQSAKIADAVAELDADIVGLIELENSGTDAAVADLVAKVNALSSRTYDYVPTGFIGTDAIAVGFIYDPATVSATGDFAVLDSTVSPAFIDDKNRPALAQTFTDLASGEAVTMAVNHLKSKGSPCDTVVNPGDPAFGVAPYGAGDDVEVAFEGNCNLTRAAAAKVLGQWLDAEPTGQSSDHLLILGDLNAYANETPITELEGQGYVDLNEQFTGSNAWADGGHSFVFNGEFGTLDYGMANPALAARVTGAAAWHINADEPFAIDYQNFNPPGQASPDQWKSSDHDPLLIGLDLQGAVGGPSCNGLEATIVGTEDGERIDGTPGDDVIVGLGGNDRIFGRGGNDVICGDDGDDRIFGQSGDDTLDGGAGSDGVFGGSGNDTATGGDDDDRVLGGGGDDDLSGGAGGDQILGNGGVDTLSGGPGGDRILGNGGADTLSGGDGGDVLVGGSGGDTMSGDAGDDILRGNAGNDSLDGGADTDVLQGNGGTDTCINGETLRSCEL